MQTCYVHHVKAATAAPVPVLSQAYMNMQINTAQCGNWNSGRARLIDAEATALEHLIKLLRLRHGPREAVEDEARPALWRLQHTTPSFQLCRLPSLRQPMRDLVPSDHPAIASAAHGSCTHLRACQQRAF